LATATLAAASATPPAATFEGANLVRSADGVDAVVEVLAGQGLDRRVLVGARRAAAIVANAPFRVAGVPWALRIVHARHGAC
jgi:hypothetical protein